MRNPRSILRHIYWIKPEMMPHVRFLAGGELREITVAIWADAPSRLDMEAALRGSGWKTVPLAPGADLRSETVASAAAVLLAVSSEAGVAAALGATRQLRAISKALPLILATNVSSEEIALSCLRVGISDLIRLPAAGAVIRGAIELAVVPVETQMAAPESTMIGQSVAMRRIREFIGKLARTSATVLITGETGTGKELVARMIHDSSPRAGKPLITVNCAAVPDSLFESEFFGFERGAFTGAVATQDGKLGMAHGGTLFLDEIGDMSAYVQAKLLRVLETGELYRLGGRRPVPIDVRFIAASNRPLEQLAEQQLFRRDLFYRLNVGRVALPPLRERKDDIPAIVDYHLHQLSLRSPAGPKRISAELCAALVAQDWPGNIRELKNVLEVAYLSALGDVLTVADLPELYSCHIAGISLPVNLVNERDQLLSALRETDWNKSKAAEKLNWSRMTLYRKIAKHRLHIPRAATV